MENKDLGKASVGVQTNVAAALCYGLGWVSGLAFFLIEKENKFIRFHAMQSIIVFGVLNLLSIILPVALMISGTFMIGSLLSQLIGYAGIVLWIVLLVKAYQGEKFKLPIAGEIAEQIVK